MRKEQIAAFSSAELLTVIRPVVRVTDMSHSKHVHIVMIGLLVVVLLLAFFFFALFVKHVFAPSPIDDTSMATTTQSTQVVAQGPFTFVCPDTATFSISYSGDQNASATLELDGASYQLSRAISGSGAKYTDNTQSIVYWEQGGQARIEKNGQELHAACVLQQK